MTIGRIGFCCKCLDDAEQTIPELNTKTTTVTWLNRQPRDAAVARLWALAEHNIRAVYNLVDYVGKLEPQLRMVRLGSDILPVYTHDDWRWFWQQPDVIKYCQDHFSKVGQLARDRDVRLSFHPGQFVCLASDNDDVVNRSIEEFEYHASMAAWMGYAQKFQDFKINVHIAGRRGPQGIRAAHSRLSPEARNCITIENEEITWGLDACLTLVDLVPIVLDIHHHHIYSGEYIEANDPRIGIVGDSWRGVRPAIHYSASREDCLVGHPVDQRPDLGALLEAGYRKAKLRAHSDYMWNHALNTWALSHGVWADIQVESKCKNLSSRRLYDYYLGSQRTSTEIQSFINTRSALDKYPYDRLGNQVSGTDGSSGQIGSGAAVLCPG